MESLSTVQRSNNTTPHHHFYGSAEQPHSFTNSIISNHSQLSYLDNPLPGDGNIINNVRRTPRLYTPTNIPSHRKNRSRTHSPSVHSSGGGSNIIDSSLSPALLSHHIHHFGENRIPTSGTNSNSITPPNSNSNTTISCGSGNSTSANIGVPTTPKTTLNHNNNHIKRRTDLENHKNQGNTKPKAKKCILEEDDEIEKCEKGARIRTSWVGPNQEFLPICDALFNVISLALYFCDIVFDVLTAYTWYKLQDETELFLEDENEEHQMSKGIWRWSIVAIAFIALSTLLSQALSYKWYKESARRGQMGPDGIELEGPPPPCSTGVLVIMHLSLCGVLWRYFKLFIPVDLRFVKNEVRDLCLLRLVHAFCEAVPMLLINLYLIWSTTPGPEAISDFTIVSTSLSLFSVCWALASFSKNVRKPHKLVFTWGGIICQFLWHIGTVVSRVLVLSLYSAVYQFFVFLVLILHWFCMLMWLISPKNLYHGEKISIFRKITYSSLIAVVYTFSYVNVEERKSRQKVLIYYVIMFLENSLLISVWLIAKNENEIWYKTYVISAVFSCFAGGILFMCLYYRFFHLKRLSYVYDTSTSSSIYRSSLNGDSTVNINGAIYSSPVGKGMKGINTATIGYLRESNTRKRNGIIPEVTSNLEEGTNTMKNSPIRYNKRNGSDDHDKTGLKSDKGGNVGGQRGALYNGHIPGVFNCRFHPAMKRKKKKPTTATIFVPPPTVQQTSTSPVVDATTVHSLRSQASSTNRIHSPNPHQSSSNTHNMFNDRRNTFGQFDLGDVMDSENRNIGHGNDGTNNNRDGNDRKMSPDYVSMGLDPSGVGVSSSYGKMPIILPAGPGGRMFPFWKRPLSISENEGSVGSRVDIQQKLQEKKQQQLAELREIEEEIKKGKFKRPQFNDPQPLTVRQPIPVEKKQPWFRANHRSARHPPMMIPTRPPLIIPTSNPDANEIILDPQYLLYTTPTFDGSDYYDSPEWPINYYEPLYQNEMGHQSGEMPGKRKNQFKHNNRSSKESIYKSYRIHSDIDSQMSLPRSYTLPREFKYKRKFRKPIKTEQFLPSTNSSDGDVDSGEEDPEIYSHLNPYPFPIPSIEHIQNNNNIMPTASVSAPQPSKKNPIIRRHKLHETKL